MLFTIAVVNPIVSRIYDLLHEQSLDLQSDLTVRETNDNHFLYFTTGWITAPFQIVMSETVGEVACTVAANYQPGENHFQLY